MGDFVRAKVDTFIQQAMVGERYLHKGDVVECRWPDGTTTTHEVRFRRDVHYVKHLGRYPGDWWFEDTTRQNAYITIPHRGSDVQIILTDDGAPPCRLLGDPDGT